MFRDSIFNPVDMHLVENAVRRSSRQLQQCRRLERLVAKRSVKPSFASALTHRVMGETPRDEHRTHGFCVTGQVASSPVWCAGSQFREFRLAIF